MEISPEELKPFLVNAAAKISETAKIDGFRPGKAPYEIISKKFGEAAILEEAAESIIAKTYYQAVTENKLATIGAPQVAIEKIAPNNPFVYKATAPVLPEIELGDYKKIKLERKNVEIKDEQADKVIADIQKMRAKEKIVDRPAKPGDRLEIDFDVLRDNAPIENGKQSKYPITIGEGRFIPGFEDQLVGLSAAGEKEFELSFPENYYEKSLAGKPAVFKVKCNAVYEVELPKLDDDFARDVSGDKYKTVADLRGGIKENLAEEEKAKQEQRLEAEMLDRLVEITKFGELPDILIDNEAHRLVHEMEHSLSAQGLEFSDYLKSINKTEEDLEKDLRPQAEKRVKSSIVAREVFHEQKLEVTDEEVSREIDEIMKQYPANPEIRKQLEEESYQEYLRNMLGNRKVIEFLKKEMVA